MPPSDLSGFGGGYKRPGNISNKVLVDSRYEDQVTLKSDLMEHHDFETLPHQAWKYLTSWYDFVDKHPIVRPVAFDKKTNNYFVDLYLTQNTEEQIDPLVTDINENDNDITSTEIA